MKVKQFKTVQPNKLWAAILEDDNIIMITYRNLEITIEDNDTVYHNEYLGEQIVSTNLIKQKLIFIDFTFPTENLYDVDYENFKNDKTAEDFQSWWINEGSELCPGDGEPLEDFCKRICGIAWNNGAFMEARGE